MWARRFLEDRAINAQETALAATYAPATMTPRRSHEESTMTTATRTRNGTRIDTRSDTASHPYAGMWVTADGYIRHELLPDGRYDEARGTRRSAYQGRYWIEGDHIEYVDDTGFTADGDFRDGVLYHAGMVLYREAAKR
jgi:hypothetical protein